MDEQNVHPLLINLQNVLKATQLQRNEALDKLSFAQATVDALSESRDQLQQERDEARAQLQSVTTGLAESRAKVAEGKQPSNNGAGHRPA